MRYLAAIGAAFCLLLYAVLWPVALLAELVEIALDYLTERANRVD